MINNPKIFVIGEQTKFNIDSSKFDELNLSYKQFSDLLVIDALSDICDIVILHNSDLNKIKDISKFDVPVVVIIAAKGFCKSVSKLKNYIILEDDNQLSDMLDLFLLNYNDYVDFRSIIFTRHTSMEMIDETVNLLKDFVICHANLDELEMFKINIVYRELMTNAVRHGNKFDENKLIQVELMMDDQIKNIYIKIKDEGVGFDYKSAYDNVDKFDELRVKQRGLFLINEFSEKIICKNNKMCVQIKLNQNDNK